MHIQLALLTSIADHCCPCVQGSGNQWQSAAQVGHGSGEGGRCLITGVCPTGMRVNSTPSMGKSADKAGVYVYKGLPVPGARFDVILQPAV